ncbi:hypothetical protein GCM10027442_37620 [Emticicia fontis]
MSIVKTAGTAKLSLTGQSVGGLGSNISGNTLISLQSAGGFGNPSTNEISFNDEYLIRYYNSNTGFSGSSSFGIYQSSNRILYHNGSALELVPVRVQGATADIAVFNNTNALASNVNNSVYFKTGDYYTGILRTIGIDNTSARLGFFTGANNSLLERFSITNTGLVGIGLTSPNQLLDVNGRVRIRHNGVTAGIWMSNSTNGLTDADGAFYGNKSDTETGIWVGNGWRFWVNGAGNATVSGLAGTGTRSVYADASGMLTTTAPVAEPKTYYSGIGSASFKALNNNSGTFVAENLNGIGYMSAGSTDRLIANFNLPTGARITEITLYYLNMDNTKRFSVFANKSGYNASFSSEIVYDFTSQISESNTAIKSQVFPVEFLKSYIDNEIYIYSIRISVQTTEGANSTWSNNMGIKGIKITYTL